jgi:Domain of unknown function (DUF1905)
MSGGSDWAGSEPIASFTFEAATIEWCGPPPFLFAAIPEELVGEVRYAAKVASYGWGVVPVEAQIGATEFETSLFPRGGTYLLPIKVTVQRREGIGVGDHIRAEIRIEAR